MKKKILLRLVLFFGIALVSFATIFKYSIRVDAEKSSTDSYKETESDEAYDDPIRRAEYEFNMLKNPATGKIPEGVFALELAQAKDLSVKSRTMRVHANTYTYQGPNNRGGRTRAIAYDVRYNGTTNRIILAGGVSGGIFKSTDDGATWTRKSPTNQLFNVTSIAQDPRPGFQDTWYYATGETIGNSASITGAPYLGNGIYKSTDNGETWSRLANSNLGALETFDAREDLISKIVVNPTNGDVYAGAMDEIMRSQNGGANWSSVLSSGALSISTRYLIDLVITSTGRIYAGVSGGSPTGPTNDMPGVWTSTTGNAGSWTKIAGPGGTPAGWNNDGAYGRVVLGLAPSNENILYALYYNNQVNPAKEADFFVYDASIPAWTDRSANLPDEPGAPLAGNDPFSVQSGYDLVVSVKPDDPNTVFIGGTNIYRSTDGFATTTNTTRIGGYNSPANYALYPNSHSDIHSIVFQPGSSTTMLCGNDGGIQRTTNNMAGSVVWTDICTNGYRTYQYYYVTMDPRNANAKVLGGAQDNGSTRNIGGTGSDFELVWSGDGVSVGLSDLIGGNTFEYVGSQQGDISRRNSTSPLQAGTNIRPAAATDNGLFVTLFLLDPDNTQTLYYASDSSLYRNTSASTATTGNWTAMTGIPATIVDGASPKTQITSLAVTRGTYNAATASLFIGTNEGRVYRLDDPANAAAATAPVNISTGLPTGYVSSISVNPRNDDTVLVTFSNYGINNVWWTGNANAASPTWLNVEGGLTAPSYRSSAIAITNTGVEYFVGTSVGLYRAGTINGASPGTTSWTQEGASDIGNALVSAMALRPVDNKLLVGTHGYGMWSTNLALAITPVSFTNFSGKTEDRSNKLSWRVENEINNGGYEVQRKYQGEKEFSKIGFVAAKNNNVQTNEYAFDDLLIDLGKENTSYRLKQIDVDGNFAYSSIISLQRKASSKFVEYVSLSGGQLIIRMNGANAGEQITLRLLDISGRVLQKLKLENKTQRVDISQLPRAPFIVEITHPDGRRFTQKMIY